MTYYLNWDLKHESQPALKKKSKHEIKLSKDEISHLIYALWGINELGESLVNLKQLGIKCCPASGYEESIEKTKALRKKEDFLNDLAHKLEKFVIDNH